MHGLITKQIASVSILPLCFVVSSILHSQNTLFSSTLKKKKKSSLLRLTRALEENLCCQNYFDLA